MCMIGRGIDATLCGLSGCDFLLGSDIKKFKPVDLLETYDEWRQEFLSNEDDDPDAQKKNSGKVKPFLAVGVDFCEAYNHASDTAQLGFDWSLYEGVVEGFPKGAEATLVVEWLYRSPMAEAAFEAAWAPTLAMCSAAVVDLTGLPATSCPHRSALVDENYLQLLVREDLPNLAAEAKRHIDFSSGGASTNVLQHARLATIMQSLFSVSDKEGGFRFDCFQHDATTAELGLSATLCSELLLIYAQMRTVAMVAAVAHQCIYKGYEEDLLVRPSDALSSQGRLHKLVPGLKHEPMAMLDYMGAAALALLELLATDEMLDLDNKGFNLRKPMSHCCQWAKIMGWLLQGLREQWLFGCSEALRLEATALEEAIPRWDGVLQTEKLDHKLAKARLLDHAKRPIVKPAIKFLQEVMEQVCVSAKRWGLENKIDKAISSFVDKAIETGGQYLVIVAALNAVINYRTAARSNAMADEILGIIRKRYDENASSTFKCPPVLRDELLAMSAGAPLEPAATNPPSAAQEVAKREAPSRPFVQTPLASQSAGSSSSRARPAVVKREAPAPPGEAEGPGQAKKATKGRGKGTRSLYRGTT